MQQKPLLYLAFISLCLLAIGGGNQLRHWLNPEDAPSGNSLFASIGKSIKGAVRSHLGTNGPDPDNPKLVSRGRSIYADYCASCHGKNLEGQPNWRRRNSDGTLPAPPHDANGHTWHHPDQLLFDYTKKGGQKLAPEGFKSAMPGFSNDLNDGDIWAVLSFIKSRWPDDVRARQLSLNPKD
jgi:hypothetical protein